MPRSMGTSTCWILRPATRWVRSGLALPCPIGETSSYSPPSAGITCPEERERTGLPRVIEESIDRSLRRMKTDHVDIL